MGNDIVGVFVIPAVDVQIGEGLGVAVGRDDLALLHNLAADGANLVAGVAVFRAGGFLGIAQFSLVAESGDGLALLHRLAADRANFIAGVTVFGASSFLGVFQLSLVAQSGNGLTFL